VRRSECDLPVAQRLTNGSSDGRPDQGPVHSPVRSGPCLSLARAPTVLSMFSRCRRRPGGANFQAVSLAVGAVDDAGASLEVGPPLRNREFLSPHHRLTCPVKIWELVSKLASPL